MKQKQLSFQTQRGILFLLTVFFIQNLHAQQPELVLPIIHGVPVKGMATAKEGAFFASCSNKSIKIWDNKSGQLIRTIPWHQSGTEEELKGKFGFVDIDISPDGSKLLTASDCGASFEDSRPQVSTKIQLWSNMGKLLKTLHTFKEPTCISHVEISPDGKLALAIIGHYSPGHFANTITYIWDIETGKEKMRRAGEWGKFASDNKHLITRNAEYAQWIDLSTQKVEAAAPLATATTTVGATSDGTYLFTATSKEWVVWNLRQKKKIATHPIEEVGSRDKSYFSEDGKSFIMTELLSWSDTIRITRYDPLSGQVLSQFKRSLSSHLGFWGEISRDGNTYTYVPMTDVGDTRSAIHAISSKDGSREFTFGLAALEGNEFNLIFDEKVLVRNDTIYFMLDTPLGILLFNTAAKIVEESPDEDLIKDWTESSTWDVGIEGGRAINLFKKGESNIVATILPIGKKDWVISTPSGLFDGSEKGKQSLHYVNGLEVIPLESYEARYWVPGLLDKLLSGLSPKEIRDVSGLSLDELYPIIKAKIDGDNLIIDIQERSGGLGELNLYINGSIVNRNLNRQKQLHLEEPLKKYAKHFYTQRPNTISLQAFNKGDWMKSRPVKLPPYTPSFPIKRDHKLAHFHAIVVGTSDYDGDNLDLSYAGKDAVSIHKALTVSGEALFENRTDIRLFTTDDVPKAGLPTKNNIKKALDEITKKAEPIDLVLVYFAGHGKAFESESNKPRFYYLTQSMNSFAQLTDPQARKLDAISQEELTDWLGQMGAKKKVMILDACNSGQMVNTLIKDRAFTESQLIALDRMKDRTGMYILAGSAADRESYEATPFGQGLLTFSLLQGMKELAIKDPNGEVDILQLLMHAENQVPKLAKTVGVNQRPKMYNQDGLSSFPIGIVEDPAAIPVAEVKPLLIQPLLLKEGELEDPLALMPKLEAHIRKIVRRGSNHSFQNIRHSVGGYSIRGTYTEEGSKVHVKGYLSKGGKRVKDSSFQVEGKKSELAGVVSLVFEQAERFIQ